MSKYERTARIESIGTDGVFEMTLATEGEASDGHVLSIKGGQIPERMPLLASHWNDPNGTLGSVTNPTKNLGDSPPRLLARGNIEMNGPMAEARRDLAHMIAEGHVNAVSIRWDEVPGKSIRRVNLPSDHPHFVDAETANGPARWGIYFEEWIAREGSVVALGADTAALIGRADSSEGDVQNFWRGMADDSQEPERVPGDTTKILQWLRNDSRDAMASGATVADLINSVASGTDLEDEASQLVEVEIGGQRILLPAELATALADERSDRSDDAIDVEVKPDPEPEADLPPVDNWDLSGVTSPIDTEEFGRLLSAAMDEQDVRIRKTVDELLAQATGKVKSNVSRTKYSA